MKSLGWRASWPKTVALAFVAGLTGCESDGTATAASDLGSAGDVNTTGDSSTADAAADGPTWHGEIGPIVAKRCMSCHQEGESAPFALETVDAMRTYATAAVAAIEGGRMPPWMPDRDCRSYQEERLIEPAELDLIRAWIAADMPEGVATGAAPVAPDRLTFEPTHEGRSAEGYLPNPALPDDWRCFILDVNIDRDYYMTAATVVPDAKPVVHHALVYAVDGSMRESLEDADAKEAGAGYTCFGGPNPSTGEGGGGIGAGFTGASGFPNQLAAWVPGIQPTVFPDGTAIRIVKDSIIVMQVHYSTLTSEPILDRSTFQMRLTEEKPELLYQTKPLAIPSIAIPAGEAASTHTRVFKNWSSSPVTLSGGTGHMHLLGQFIEAKVEREGQPEECLVRIPDWDFNWQQAYRFLPDEQAVIAPGDGVRLTCTFDNSAGNQAVVNGEQLAPRDVSWGESTLDEMCLFYVAVVQPYEEPEPTTTTPCESTDACVAACEDPRSIACVLGCEETSVSCLTCVAKSAQSCAASCLGSLLAARDCLVDCGVGATAFGSGFDACLSDSCPDAYSGFTACMDPKIAAGECDAALTGCGVTFPE
jgi:hypothetical protein